MANETGMPFPSRVRKGEVLTAKQMNLIVNAIIRRIEGGKGINVREINQQIIIEASDL